MSWVQLAVSMLYQEDDFQLKALQIQWKLSNRPAFDCTRRPVLKLWGMAASAKKNYCYWTLDPGALMQPLLVL